MATIYSTDGKTHVHPAPSTRTEKRPLSEQILHDIKQELGRLGHKHSSAIACFPKKITFETQEVKEEIILLMRRHVITNIPWVAVAVLMILAPLVLQIVPLIDFLPFNFQLMTMMIWYMIVLAFILESFLSWYFNVYIVTDERIIDIDFFSLIYKKISETKIERIQDVSYSQGGFFQSMLNYGTVTIQTAGEVPEFEFDAVPMPAQVSKVLNQLVTQEEQEKIEGKIR